VIGISLKSHKLEPLHIRNISFIPTNGVNRLHALYKMYRLADHICREEQVDIIQAIDSTFTGLVGYIMKKKYRKILEVCVVGNDPYDDYWLRMRIWNRLLAPVSRHIISACDGVQVDAMRAAYSLVMRGKVARSKIFHLPFVPYGIRHFRLANGLRIRNELLAAGETKLVLFVGRLTRQKNVHFLLRCFREIVERFPGARLLVIGDGEEETNLKLAARTFGIADKIDWKGFVAYSKLPEYFRAADVFVLPSLLEGTPRVLILAAAAGIPIVSTDVGGADSVIEQGKTGFIVRQGDEDEFTKKILFLLSNSRIARRMGRAGQTTVLKEVDRRKILARQIEIWDKIVSGIGYARPS
jgi:glycosyltransferase involved in cell wall biosynthesis